MKTKPNTAPDPDSEEQAAALGDVVDDYLERRAAGERPEISEYAKRHPEIAELIRQSLRALEVVGDTVAPAGQSSEQHSFDAPKTLGDFRILGELGRGGMGVVYEAEQLSLGRMVALKVLPFAAIMDPRAITRFKNEARAAATLDHPNIVPVHGVGNERGVYYYAMSLITGLTLAEIISRLRDQILRPDDTSLSIDGLAMPDPERPTSSISSNHQLEPTIDSVQHTEVASLTARDHRDPTTHREIQAAVSTHRSRFDREYFRSVARLGAQAAEALDHAHQRGIVHRDIKPGNLMVDHHGKPWVTDFGLARIESEAGLTMTGDIVGTLRYMAPEQALAKRVIVDHRVDLYSLGATLYELISLQPVFDGQNRKTLLEQIAFQDAKPLRQCNASTPVDLQTIVHKSISKDPNDRYRTAQEMADDLHCFLDQVPIKAHPLSVAQKASRWLIKRKGLVGSIAAILIAAVVGLSISNYKIRKERSGALQAGQRERVQRELAEKHLHRSQEVVDTFLTRVSEEHLLNTPAMQPLRKDLLELALAYYQDFIEQSPDNPELQSKLGAAYYHFGKIQGVLGNTSEAIDALRHAIRIRESIVLQSPEDAGRLSDLADSSKLLALMYNAIGDPEASRQWTRKTTELCEDLAERHPDAEDYQTKLSSQYNNVGRELSETGNLAEAIAFHERSVEIQSQLVKRHSDDSKHLADLATYLGNLAVSYADTGQRNKAFDFFREAIQAFEEVTRSGTNNSPDLRFAFAATCYNFANKLRLAMRVNEAMEMAEKAIATLEQLTEENPAVSDYQCLLSMSYSTYADILLKDQFGQPPPKDPTPDWLAAVNYQEKSLQLIEELSHRHPEMDQYSRALVTAYQSIASLKPASESIVFVGKAIDLLKSKATKDPKGLLNRLQLALCYERLGRSMREMEDFDSALENLRKARQLQEELAVEFPEDLACRRPIAWSDLLLIYNQTGEWEEAAEVLRRVTPQLEKLCKTDPAAEDFQQDLQLCYRRGIQIFQSTGRTEEARAVLDSALTHLEGLMDHRVETPGYQGRVASWHLCFSDAHRSLGKPGESLAQHRRMIQFQEGVVANNPNDQPAQRLLALLYGKLFNLYPVVHGTSEAEAALKKAIVIRRKFAEEEPDNLSCKRNLSINCNSLAWHYVLKQNLDDAHCYFQESAQIQKQLADQDESDELPGQLIGHQFQLALIHRAQGDDSSLQKVLSLTEAVLTKCPEPERDATFWGYVGQHMYFAEKYSKAREAFERAIDASGETEPTIQRGPRWWYLAICLARTGENEQAQEYYQRLTDQLKQVPPMIRVRDDFYRQELAELLGNVE